MINEAIVEQAALAWLRELGCEVLSALAIAPGEPAAERARITGRFSSLTACKPSWRI
jgi:hypothetical protein